jgi:hypothetical protein
LEFIFTIKQNKLISAFHELGEKAAINRQPVRARSLPPALAVHAHGALAQTFKTGISRN